MNYNCHKLGGVSAAFCVGYMSYSSGFMSSHLILSNQTEPIPHLSTIAVMSIASWIFSTLPDIDHPKSNHGLKHPYIAKWLNKHGGHRGFTHYPITLIVFIGFCLGFIKATPLKNNILLGFEWFFIGACAGWASHIFLDLLNSAGVSILAPFSKIRFKLPTGVKIQIKSTKQKKKKNKKTHHPIRWRYLRGGNTLDDFLLVIICVSCMLLTICLCNPEVFYIICKFF